MRVVQSAGLVHKTSVQPEKQVAHDRNGKPLFLEEGIPFREKKLNFDKNVRPKIAEVLRGLGMYKHTFTRIDLLEDSRVHIHRLINEDCTDPERIKNIKDKIEGGTGIPKEKITMGKRGQDNPWQRLQEASDLKDKVKIFRDEVRPIILNILQKRSWAVPTSTLIHLQNNGCVEIRGLTRQIQYTDEMLQVARNQIQKEAGIEVEKIKFLVGKARYELIKPTPQSVVNQAFINGRKVKIKRGLGERADSRAIKALKMIIKKYEDLQLEGKVMVGVTVPVKLGEAVLRVYGLTREQLRAVEDDIRNNTGIMHIEIAKEKVKPVEITDEILGKYYRQLKEELHKRGWVNSSPLIVNRLASDNSKGTKLTYICIVLLIDENDYKSCGGEVGLNILKEDTEADIKENMCVPLEIKRLATLNQNLEKICREMHLPNTQIIVQEKEEPVFKDSTATIKLIVYKSELKSAEAKQVNLVKRPSFDAKQSKDELSKQSELREQEISKRDVVLNSLSIMIANKIGLSKYFVDKPKIVKGSPKEEKEPTLKILISPYKDPTSCEPKSKKSKPSKTTSNTNHAQEKGTILHWAIPVGISIEPVSHLDAPTIRRKCSEALMPDGALFQELYKYYFNPEIREELKDSPLIDTERLSPRLAKLKAMIDDHTLRINVNDTNKQVTLLVPQYYRGNPVVYDFLMKVIEVLMQSMCRPFGYMVTREIVSRSVTTFGGNELLEPPPDRFAGSQAGIFPKPNEPIVRVQV